MKRKTTILNKIMKSFPKLFRIYRIYIFMCVSLMYVKYDESVEKLYKMIVVAVTMSRRVFKSFVLESPD